MYMFKNTLRCINIFSDEFQFFATSTNSEGCHKIDSSNSKILIESIALSTCAAANRAELKCTFFSFPQIYYFSTVHEGMTVHVDSINKPMQDLLILYNPSESVIITCTCSYRCLTSSKSFLWAYYFALF